MKDPDRFNNFKNYVFALKIDLSNEESSFFETLLSKLSEDEFGNFLVSGMDEETLFLLGKEHGEKYGIEIPESIENKIIEEQRSRSVPVTTDEALREEIIPIPWEYWKNLEYLFPHNFTRREVILQDIKKTKEKVLIIRRKAGSKIITYRTFIPEGVGDTDLPKFGELTDNLYKALIWAQKTQHHKSGFITWANVRLTDLLKLCGYHEEEAKGRTYFLAKRSLQTLAYTIYEIKDEKTGKILEIENIVSYKSKLKGQGFYYILNKDHLKLLTALSMGERGIKYLGYDTRLQLESRKIDKHKRKIFEYLLELKGYSRRYPVTIKKLLVKAAGYTLKEVKEMVAKGKLTDSISTVLREAVRMGYISDYEIVDHSKEDPLLWKIKFTAARRKRSHPVDHNLVEELIRWMTQPLFEDDTQIDRKRRYVINVIKKYGADPVREAFEQAKEGNRGPEMFWEIIKEKVVPNNV